MEWVGGGGGGGVYASTHCHYVGGLCIWVGDGEHLAQVASSSPPRGLFTKAPARGCNRSGPDPHSPALPCPDLALTWHPQTRRQAAQRSLPPHPPPPANNSHSAGYQPPSLRINYRAGPVSLILDTFYTTLILNINSFFLLF